MITSMFLISIMIGSIDIVVITGNDGHAFNDTMVVRLYPNNTSANSPCTLPPLPIYPIENAAGVNTVDEELIICGGKYPATSSCFKFDEESWIWEKFTDMKTKRFEHAMTTNQADVLYVTGGTDEVNNDLSVAEKYEDGEWSSIKELPVTIRDHCLVSLSDNKLLNIGGWNKEIQKVSYDQ